MQEQDVIPQAAEHVASMIQGTATHYERAVTFQVVAKLPVYKVSMLDAYAKAANKSRTEMLSILLGLAFDEVHKELNDEGKQKIASLDALAMTQLTGEPG